MSQFGKRRIEIVEKFLNLKLLWTTCQANSGEDSTEHVNLRTETTSTDTDLYIFCLKHHISMLPMFKIEL